MLGSNLAMFSEEIQHWDEEVWIGFTCKMVQHDLDAIYHNKDEFKVKIDDFTNSHGQNNYIPPPHQEIWKRRVITGPAESKMFEGTEGALIYLALDIEDSLG